MIINTKKELREVLNYERQCWGIPILNSWLGWMKTDLLFWIHPGSPYQFMYCLRAEEYFANLRGGGSKLILGLLRYKHKKLQFRAGIELFPGCAEIGVAVNHGKCVISKVAHIGRDSVILSDVTIGGSGGAHDDGAATIGERVFIGSGARIIGKISICNDVVIAANAVVVKDITEPGTVWGGIPAKIISKIGDKPFIRRKESTNNTPTS